MAGVVICTALPAATYEVGPGKTYGSIARAPWATLQPGDTVLIYGSSRPYREKWAICRQGTASAPITVRGVAGADGNLPVIDGEGAVAPSNLAYWNENRGVIKVGGCSNPADVMPAYVNIERLDVRGAREYHNFTATDGSVRYYDGMAASIYIEKGTNITIRNSVIRDSANGIFVSSGGGALSRNILIESNYIHDNGNVGSGGEHNIYAQALGITYQYNHLGPLTPGSGGENLKDRSAGTVIRYNWIEAGNHQLDLVDAASDTVINTSPDYRRTYVYGNVLIEQMDDYNHSVVHYGGDSATTSTYRKGTLFFYNNTIASTRTDRTTMFRPATNEETIDARNNVFWASAGGDRLEAAERNGTVLLSHNCAQSGWLKSFGSFEGSVNDDGTMAVSATFFMNAAGGDYRLAPGSSCAAAAGPLAGGALPVTLQYQPPQSSIPRAFLTDIGAFGAAGAAAPQPGMGGAAPGAAPQPGMGGAAPGTAPQPGTGGAAPGTAPQPGTGGAAPGTAQAGPGAAGALIRVNAGGPAYTDSSGATWQADAGYWGGLVHSTTAPIANTTTPALYQTERYGTGQLLYVFSVANGNRTVRLKFAEIYFSRPGERVFNVSINGQPVLYNFDIAAEAGAYTAIDKTFNVNVQSGELRIDFVPLIQYPKVSAIEVQ